MRRTEARQGVRMIKFWRFLAVTKRRSSVSWRRPSFWVWASAPSGAGASALKMRAKRAFWTVGLAKRRANGFRWIGRGSRAALSDALRGFTAEHFHEHLVRDHGFSWGYTWTKAFLHSRGLLERAKRRGAHRRKRPRRPLPGMMLHQDGSRHEWLSGQPALDLIVTIDDATGEIYSAFLVEEEGTASTFRALLEVFARHGLPLSLYTDRGSHYFHTPEAGGKVDRGQPTQVGRALAQLGIEHIAAYSPQARGRSERLFRTLQGRVPKELALAGITTVEAANAWLRDTYIPAHNARFAIKAEQEGSAFVAVPGSIWARFCASRKNASLVTTIACPSTANCKYRKVRCARTSSKHA